MTTSSGEVLGSLSGLLPLPASNMPAHLGLGRQLLARPYTPTSRLLPALPQIWHAERRKQLLASTVVSSSRSLVLASSSSVAAGLLGAGSAHAAVLLPEHFTQELLVSAEGLDSLGKIADLLLHNPALALVVAAILIYVVPRLVKVSRGHCSLAHHC